MLKTFRVNDVCKFPNAELYEQAIEYARSKGVPVYRGCKKGSFNAFPFLGLGGTIEMCGFLSTNKSPNITIPEFFQNCDNWKECGSKPSEGEYIRYGAKVKVKDNESFEWKIGYRYLAKLNNRTYQHLVLIGNDYNLFRFCKLDETPEQTERQMQIAELETKAKELHEQIKKLKDAENKQ